MENTEDKIEELYERGTAYARTSLKLTKLKALESSIELSTILIVKVSVALLLLAGTMLLSVGIALLLGEALGEMYYGFFIVAGFYFLVGVIAHIYLETWIEKPLSKIMISKLLHTKSNDED